jgi:hypothetical protein
MEAVTNAALKSALLEQKVRELELQVAEYRRFCEGIVASTETDLTFWKRRAQFCLDAMKKPKREECPHLTFEDGGICPECSKKKSQEPPEHNPWTPNKTL